MCAVRGGPVMSKNIASYIMGKELKPCVPQDEFLALLTTGDGKEIGQKFGMVFRKMGLELKGLYWCWIYETFWSLSAFKWLW